MLVGHALQPKGVEKQTPQVANLQKKTPKIQEVEVYLSATYSAAENKLNVMLGSVLVSMQRRHTSRTEEQINRAHGTLC